VRRKFNPSQGGTMTEIIKTFFLIIILTIVFLGLGAILIKKVFHSPFTNKRG